MDYDQGTVRRRTVISPNQAMFGSAAPDAQLLAWIQTVQYNGGSVSDARKTLVNNLIGGLKADGVWQKLDYLLIGAAENSVAGRVDMVGQIVATVVGAPTFTTDLGWTGTDLNATAATDYLDTNFTPVAGSHYQQNAAHISAWSNTNTISTAAGGALMGLTGVSPLVQSNIFPRYSDGTWKSRCNDGTLDSGAANADSTGHYIANRDGASTSQAYRNGSLVRSPNTASSAGSFTRTFLICAVDNDPAPPVAGFGSACQIPMASVGGNLSATDVTNFYNRLRTYMTAVGVP